ncbi:MAG TPA: hypothetical protein VKW77_05290, partial [Acidimicrobiales bacterium]|nr:hypothetical protein [Acidimicrobiales bacterium]
FLRYHAEARSAFHRNYQALMKSLANNEVEPGPSEEVPKASAPPVEPNPPDDEGGEAASGDPQAVAASAGSGATAVSPNEASAGESHAPRGVSGGVREGLGEVGGASNPPPIAGA